MAIQIINCFAAAACEVLLAETALVAKRSEPTLSDSLYLTDEVTVIISVVGDINGTVLYSLRQSLALELIKQLMGEPPTKFGSLEQSGVAELSNVITGKASVMLASLNCHINISPPTMLLGTGTALSTLDLPRWVAPLELPGGTLTVHLATSTINWNGNSKAPKAK